MEELVFGSSLLRFGSGEDGKDIFEMHRLIRLFVTAYMEIHPSSWEKAFSKAFSRALISTHQRIKLALEETGNSFDDILIVFDTSQMLLLSQGLAVLHHYVLRPSIFRSSVAHELEDIQSFSGRGLLLRGKLNEAEVVLHELRKGTRSKQVTVWGLGTLGEVLIEQGKLEEAHSMFLKCLDLHFAMEGPNFLHPTVFGVILFIVAIHLSIGRLKEAESLIRLSHALMLARYGRDAVEDPISFALLSLGTVELNFGNLSTPEECFEKSLAMFLALHGFETVNPKIASSTLGLGCLYKLQGKLDEAESMFQRCLDMCVVLYGLNGNNVLQSSAMMFLSTILQAQGKHEDAVLLDKTCLDIYAEQGHFECAEAMYRKGLDMLHAIHGHDPPHHFIAALFAKLGQFPEDVGRLREAPDYYNCAFRIAKSSSGKDSAVALEMRRIVDQLGRLI